MLGDKKTEETEGGGGVGWGEDREREGRLNGFWYWENQALKCLVGSKHPHGQMAGSDVLDGYLGLLHADPHLCFWPPCLSPASQQGGHCVRLICYWWTDECCMSNTSGCARLAEWGSMSLPDRVFLGGPGHLTGIHVKK